MLPTEDLFVYVYVLIDDLINAGPSSSRRGQGQRLGAATLNC